MCCGSTEDSTLPSPGEVWESFLEEAQVKLRTEGGKRSRQMLRVLGPEGWGCLHQSQECHGADSPKFSLAGVHGLWQAEAE